MTVDQKAERRRKVSNILLTFAIVYSIFIIVGDFMGKNMDNTINMYLYFLVFVGSHEGINMGTPAGGFKQ
jgi:hypothetical protein